MNVKQKALKECHEAIEALSRIQDETTNQVLWLAIMAAKQRAEAELAFWMGAE